MLRSDEGHARTTRAPASHPEVSPQSPALEELPVWDREKKDPETDYFYILWYMTRPRHASDRGTGAGSFAANEGGWGLRAASLRLSGILFGGS